MGTARHSGLSRNTYLRERHFTMSSLIQQGSRTLTRDGCLGNHFQNRLRAEKEEGRANSSDRGTRLPSDLEKLRISRCMQSSSERTSPGFVDVPLYGLRHSSLSSRPALGQFCRDPPSATFCVLLYILQFDGLRCDFEGSSLLIKVFSRIRPHRSLYRHYGLPCPDPHLGLLVGSVRHAFRSNAVYSK